MKKAFKKTIIIIGITLLAVVGFVLIYLLSAYGLSRITVDKEPGTKDELAIYILTNGVHTDIVMPTTSPQKDWSQSVKFENTHWMQGGLPYLAMGWGDKGFYLETPEWSDLKASVAFNAAFGLGNTAIHATYYAQMKEGEACRRIPISQQQYAHLIGYIENSFQKGPDGQPIPIITTANYGKTDAFYEAKGSYSLFHTCNTWANDALKACGQKACYWTAFDTGIFAKYE